MKDKYIVTYYDVVKKFKNKKAIMKHFDCPLYIIDKIIHRPEDDCGKCHMCYSDIYSNVSITVIKPRLIDLK